MKEQDDLGVTLDNRRVQFIMYVIREGNNQKHSVMQKSKFLLSI